MWLNIPDSLTDESERSPCTQGPSEKEEHPTRSQWQSVSGPSSVDQCLDHQPPRKRFGDKGNAVNSWRHHKIQGVTIKQYGHKNLISY